MSALRILRKPFVYRFWNLTFVLIGVNLLVFLAQIAMKGNTILYDFALIPPLVSEGGEVWRLFTYMFLHSSQDFSHILFNMLGLWMFGMELERKMGSKDFLLYYLLSGFLSGLVGYLFYVVSGSLVIVVGASGAIYALMIAYAVAFPSRVLLLFGIIPVRTPMLILGYTAIAIFSEVFSVGNWANMIHLGGFAMGGLLLFLRFGENPLRLFFPRR